MSRNDVILGVVALVLVSWSLFVAMVVPRRRPDFPGNRLGLFTAVSVALVIAMLAAMELFGVEEEAEGNEAVAEQPLENGGEGEEAPPEETGTGEETGSGDAAAGAAVFESAGCGGCHTYGPAGTSGTTGPSLDDSQASFEQAVTQITNGGGGMPPYEGQLTETEIQDVAAFVTESRR
ncbi:MAG TPA: cytochrome c [Gaiellaceae bacterium]|nr:cytochrome c [Gaiellaceae bacterium]